MPVVVAIGFLADGFDRESFLVDMVFLVSMTDPSTNGFVDQDRSVNKGADFEFGRHDELCFRIARRR